MTATGENLMFQKDILRNAAYRNSSSQMISFSLNHPDWSSVPSPLAKRHGLTDPPLLAWSAQSRRLTWGRALDALDPVLASLRGRPTLPTSPATPERRSPPTALWRTRSLVTSETTLPPLRRVREVKSQSS
ncbi:PREDICTED: crooked neck-like protein 1 [Propithecus coquereli]|uniref:crooked neck-like protein 1 n=1 Tax=Propithecus coquereli TaxID=379532 RepID=UPI00063F3BDB|nr:PREDICTED: crooked neck-like protein 1 [Propithecus coquereli]